MKSALGVDLIKTEQSVTAAIACERRVLRGWES